MKFEFKLNRQQLYIALAIAAIILALAYKFLYGPTLSSISAAFKETRTKRNDIERGSRLLSNRETLFNEATQLRANFDTYQKRIATDVSPSKMLEELTRIAEGLKVNFVSVEPRSVIKNEIAGVSGYYVQMPIKVRLKCGYHELGKFISQIGGSARLMKVEEVNIRDDPKDIWHHDADLVVSAFAYMSEAK